MLSKKFIWDPQHWRFRAEEARTVADQMTHKDARTIMRRLNDRVLRSLRLIGREKERKDREILSDFLFVKLGPVQTPSPRPLEGGWLAKSCFACLQYSPVSRDGTLGLGRASIGFADTDKVGVIMWR